MSERPNVVLITTDQQRADVCAREGFPLDTTPFLDELAEDAVWFDRAYCPYPVCCPSRVSLLTGRYPSATGVRDNAIDHPVRYTANLFDVAADRGYATGLIGKNHSHIDEDRPDHTVTMSHWNGPKRTEAEADFDDWLGEHSMYALEPAPFEPSVQLCSRAVDEAIDWIEHVEEPFVLWLSLPEPHSPYQVPEPYHSLFDPDALPPLPSAPADRATKGFEYEWLAELASRRTPDGADYAEILPRLRANYYGMCRLLDDQVRRFVSALDGADRREGTVLLATSDHGDLAGEYGLMRKSPGPAEALVRVPLVVDGPGVEPRAGPSEAHVSLVDLFPTICEAIGAAIPTGVQGRSLWPLLTGEPVPTGEFDSAYVEFGYGGRRYDWDDSPTLSGNHTFEGESMGGCNTYTQAGIARMVRRDDWKLVYDAERGGELYHLHSDPAELDDRFGDPAVADVRSDLLEALTEWLVRTADPLPEPPRYEPKTAPHNWWGSPGSR